MALSVLPILDAVSTIGECVTDTGPVTGEQHRSQKPVDLILGASWSVLECGCGYKISIRPSWSVVECSGREWQMEWQIRVQAVKSV